MQNYITAPQVLEGLSLWLQRNPWALDDEPLRAAHPIVHAAESALLTMGRCDAHIYCAQPPELRSAALGLMFDFIARLFGPMADRVWSVNLPSAEPQSLSEGAWRVLEREIDLRFAMDRLAA